jgi:hypothetical protein
MTARGDAIMGFQAQTLEIFDCPLLSPARTERGAFPPRTFPKKSIFKNKAPGTGRGPEARGFPASATGATSARAISRCAGAPGCGAVIPDGSSETPGSPARPGSAPSRRAGRRQALAAGVSPRKCGRRAGSWLQPGGRASRRHVLPMGGLGPDSHAILGRWPWLYLVVFLVVTMLFYTFAILLSSLFRSSCVFGVPFAPFANAY